MVLLQHNNLENEFYGPKVKQNLDDRPYVQRH